MPKRKEANQSENTSSPLFCSWQSSSPYRSSGSKHHWSEKEKKSTLDYTKGTSTLKSTLTVTVVEQEGKSW